MKRRAGMFSKKKRKKRESKRVTTLILFFLTIILVGGMQPMFFGKLTYFGMNPLYILLPIAFVFLILAILHIQQNWALFLAWFKKSEDKGIQRYKMQRMIVLLLMIGFLGYDIAFAWYEALSKGITEVSDMSIGTIRIWSWVGTFWLAVHVGQRWRLMLSYFKPRHKKTNLKSEL